MIDGKCGNVDMALRFMMGVSLAETDVISVENLFKEPTDGEKAMLRRETCARRHECREKCQAKCQCYEMDESKAKTCIANMQEAMASLRAKVSFLSNHMRIIEDIRKFEPFAHNVATMEGNSND